jgi:amidase
VELVRALGGLRRFEFDTISAFSEFDAVLTPGLSSVAPEIGWYDPDDAWRNFRQQVEMTPWTSFVNVAGLPAIAVPTHYAGDLPLGVQLIGRAGGDATIIGLAADVEAQLPGATRWPAMMTD